MLQCFSLVYSYMTCIVVIRESGLTIIELELEHAVILVLVMVLQVTVTVRHQTLTHAYGSNRKKAYELKCPQLHAPAPLPFQMPADRL